MTIPPSCKRLAEVDFPIAVVSQHSAREKSIRHGHPSTLHLWWARRPLAACCAVLMSLLLPDPADPDCPEDFKAAARTLLPPVQGEAGPTDLDLRRALLKFIGDFANWDLASNAQYLAAARGLVRAAHPDERPLVVDPFAGGGSIPLEALRLGCDAFASDLNPVAVLINKVMLEDIPRYSNAEFTVQNANGEEVTVQGLAETLRVVGSRVKTKAREELAEFYPEDPDGARPIAYLWARTVRCKAPNCGAGIPLVRSFLLSKKANRRWALRYTVHKVEGATPRVLELVYTAWDIKAFADDVWREADDEVRGLIRKQWAANEMATGGHTWDPPEWAEIAEDGIPLPPFKWDEERRAHLRADLDATYARLYGLTRDELRYILDPADVYGPDFPGETFRVLKEKEIRLLGEYRTRRLVLAAWDRLERELGPVVVRNYREEMAASTPATNRQTSQSPGPDAARSAAG